MVRQRPFMWRRRSWLHRRVSYDKHALLGMFPRVETERLLSNPVENLKPLNSVSTLHPPLTRRVSENLDLSQRNSFCPQCSDNYEKELAKLVAVEKSFTEAKQEVNRPSLPLWLKNAKLQSSDKTTDQSEVHFTLTDYN
ncbi:Hypothetical predicted protein [Olea europaea subsp. europaea]|uniref:Uncharacterized protein n=1 Tax=Olea europaea subsp. europaea TaxID=158383 RepID=A0A8S0SCF3_OLEEU|nr:Hypothetical predicted protein [Olea europaea subsp. europaea]